MSYSLICAENVLRRRLTLNNWSERKNKLFKNEYIQIAYDHLDTFYGESKLSAGL